MMEKSHFLCGAVCAYGLYLIGLLFYRLWLSPLAKFPGPKLAAATAWYEFYYDAICHGKYTFEIGKMHKEYGQILHLPPKIEFEMLELTMMLTIQDQLSASVRGNYMSTTRIFTKCCIRGTARVTNTNFMRTCSATKKQRLPC